jgi:hypothetical protein
MEYNLQPGRRRYPVRVEMLQPVARFEGSDATLA